MKKFLSLTLAIIMMMALAAPAFAADTVSQEVSNGTTVVKTCENDIRETVTGVIVNEDFAVKTIVSEMVEQYPLADRIADAKRRYIDEEVSEEVLDSVSFSTGNTRKNSPAIASEASELMEADEAVIDYSIKNLGEVVFGGQSIGTLYSATGVQKTTGDSKQMKEANIEAYLTITWIDNFGYDNVLVEVSGGWRDYWGYVKKNKMVVYSATNLNGFGDEDTKYPSDYEFKYSNINFHGLCLDAVSYIDVNIPQGAEMYTKTFIFGYSPSIFD